MSSTDQNPTLPTREELRKLEAQEGKYHGGQVSKDSDVSAMKSMLSEQESEADRIDRVKANLPLPEMPEGVSGDLESADARTVNVGSGGVNVKLGTGGSALREPATAESSARVDPNVYQTKTEPQNTDKTY